MTIAAIVLAGCVGAAAPTDCSSTNNGSSWLLCEASDGEKWTLDLVEGTLPPDRTCDVGNLLDLLKRSREWVTDSSENTGLIGTLTVYVPPPTDGERLRQEADRADRRDKLAREIDKALEECRP